MAVWLGLWTPLLMVGIPGPACITAATVGTIVAAAWSASSASPARQRVRWMVVWTDIDDPDESARIGLDRLLHIADVLRTADADLARGQIDPIRHEEIWARCYAEAA